MLTPEFQAQIASASISQLGVMLKDNETKITSLLAEKDATGAERVIPATDLETATALDAQNDAIRAQQLAVKTNREKAQSLASKNRGTGLQLAPEPNGETRTYATAKQVSTLKSFKGDREVLHSNGTSTVMSAEKRALHLGTFLLGAVVANPEYRSELRAQAEGWGYEYRTMNEGTLGSGGYLVPPEFSMDFVYLQEQYGVADKYCRKIALASNDFREARRQSAVTAYWETENTSITESAMGIDQWQLLLKRLSGYFTISNELSADSIINLTDWLVKDCMTQIAYKKDAALFNGDGTSTYGNTVGLIPGITGVASNKGVVLQGTGTAWTAVVNADIQKLMGALPMFPGMNPKLYCSNAYYRNVLRTKMVNAGGTNLDMIASGGSMYQYDGVEVVISQVLPQVDGGTATVSLLYGDLQYSSAVGTRGGYTVALATQGDTIFQKNQTAIRIDERVGITNHELGNSTIAGPVVVLKSN
jgi:HK97 family phage major capsid protein